MAVEQLYPLTDAAIASELGHRLAALRVQRGLRQVDVAGGSGLSESTIKKLEKGRGTLLNLIAVLRELNALDALDQMLPESGVSPMQLLKHNDNKPQRVRLKKAQQDSAEEDSEW